MATTIKGRDFSSPNVYRDDNVRSGVVTISAEPLDLYGWNIINPNSQAVYIKFYDTTAPVTIGHAPAAKTLLIPGTSTVVIGTSTTRGKSQGVFNKGLKMAVTTEMQDSGSTAPTLAVYAEIYYL